MEEDESRALINFTGTTPSQGFNYVEDTWVKIRIREMEAFTEHINAVDNNIKFMWEDVRRDSLPFLDCVVHTEEERCLNLGCTVKPRTDQYLLFDSHHPLEHKLAVIRTLNHQAETVASKTEGNEKEQKHPLKPVATQTGPLSKPLIGRDGKMYPHDHSLCHRNEWLGQRPTSGPNNSETQSSHVF